MRYYWKILAIVTMHAVSLCAVMGNDSAILEDQVVGAPLTIEDVISREMSIASISSEVSERIAYQIIDCMSILLIEQKKYHPNWNVVFPMLHFNDKDGFHMFNNYLSGLYFRIRWAGEDGAPPDPVGLLLCVAITFKDSMTECGVRPEDKELLETLAFLLDSGIPAPGAFSTHSLKEVMSKVINPSTLSLLELFVGYYKKQLHGALSEKEIEADPLVVMVKKIKEQYIQLQLGVASETVVYSNIVRVMYDTAISLPTLKSRPNLWKIQWIGDALLEHQAVLDPFFHS